MGERLAGKVAIVTGAGSGIGRTAAIRFAAEGAQVGCADRDPNGLEETVLAINSEGNQAIGLEVDVTDEDSLDQMVAETSGSFGTVTVLYANAGIAGSGSAKDTTSAEWEKVIAVNLTAVWLSSRACLPGMIEAGGGFIINQASVGGLIGIPGIAPYAAAKAGVIGLTRQMAVEYGPSKIRVNAICPGTVPTPLVERTYMEKGGFAATSAAGEDLTYEEILEGSAQRYPIGRLGMTEEIAAFALYLASDESAWTTGAIVPIDGGITAA